MGQREGTRGGLTQHAGAVTQGQYEGAAVTKQRGVCQGPQEQTRGADEGLSEGMQRRRMEPAGKKRKADYPACDWHQQTSAAVEPQKKSTEAVPWPQEMKPVLVDVLVKRKKGQVPELLQAGKLRPAVEWAHEQQPLGMPLLWTAEMWPNLHPSQSHTL